MMLFSQITIYFFIINIDLDKINLDGVNFYENDAETIIHARLLSWCNKLEKCKAHKKRIKQRKNSRSIASYKMVGLVLARREKSRMRKTK